MLGARQAGAPGFRFARLDIHGGLLARAREEAQAALERDERLAGEGNRGLRRCSTSSNATRPRG